MRQLLSFLLGLVTVMLVVVTASVIWLDSTLTNQTAFVNLLAPLASDEMVRDTIATEVTALVVNQTGSGGGAVAASARAALSRQVDSVVRELLASDQFAQLWTETVKRTHDGLMASLASADAGNLFIVDGTLVADVGPLVEAATDRLAAEGLPVSFDPNANYDLTLIDSPGLTRVLAALYQLHQLLPWLVAGAVIAVMLTLVAAPFWPGALTRLAATLVLAFLVLFGVTWALPGALERVFAESTFGPLGETALELVAASLQRFLLVLAGCGAVLWLIGIVVGRLAPQRRYS